MDVSRFFSLAELTRSDTALREGIANQPTPVEVDCLRQLCLAVLDPLRVALGGPINVNSAYRSPQLNHRIGGSATSQHVEGKAADIQAAGMSVLELFRKVIQLGLPFDQVIYEARSVTARWVHVSHNGASNRGEIRVAEFGANGIPLRYPRITAAQALALTEPATRGPGPSRLEYFELSDEPEFEAAAAAPVAVARKLPKKRAKSKRQSAPKPLKAGRDAERPTRLAKKAPTAAKVSSGRRRVAGKASGRGEKAKNSLTRRRR